MSVFDVDLGIVVLLDLLLFHRHLDLLLQPLHCSMCCMNHLHQWLNPPPADLLCAENVILDLVDMHLCYV